MLIIIYSLLTLFILIFCASPAQADESLKSLSPQEWRAESNRRKLERLKKYQEHIIYMGAGEDAFHINTNEEGLQCHKGQPITGTIKSYGFSFPNREKEGINLFEEERSLNRQKMMAYLETVKQDFIRENKLLFEDLAEPSKVVTMLFDEKNYLNGLPHGRHITYWLNGQLQNETMYHKGQRLWRNTSYPHGQLRHHINFKDDKEHGPVTVYSMDGEVREEYTYINGLIQGLKKTYWPNGTLKTAVNYVDNKKEGLEKEFSEDGWLVADIEYKNGQIIKKTEY